MLVDASNAFNQLNRQLALRNISVLCPSLACFVVNIYRANAPLFVGGEVIYSREGTTQGDPSAMAIFAIFAKRPIIDRLAAAKATQFWFADDAVSGGKLRVIRMWWDMLVRYGPSFWLLCQRHQVVASRQDRQPSGSDHHLRRHRPEHHDKRCAAPWGPRLETPLSQSRLLRNELISGKASLLDWLISPLSSHTWPSATSHRGSSAVGHTCVALLTTPLSL